MKIERKLLLPIPQNFIRIEGEVNSICITELSEEQIKEYAEECKQDLISNYHKRKNEPKRK
jgi:hypothetical protein